MPYDHSAECREAEIRKLADLAIDDRQAFEREWRKHQEAEERRTRGEPEPLTTADLVMLYDTDPELADKVWDEMAKRGELG